MHAESTYKVGTSYISTVIVSARIWEKEGHRRRYFELETDGDERKAIESLWEILEGSRRAEARVEVDGRTYGYNTGVFVNSGTKKSNVASAVEDLVQQIHETESVQQR